MIQCVDTVVHRFKYVALVSSRQLRFENPSGNNRCLHLQAAPYSLVDKLNCLPTMNYSSEFREAHYKRPFSEINWILENPFIEIIKSVNLELLIVAFEQQMYRFLIMNWFQFPIIYIPASTFSQFPRLSSSLKPLQWS